jgi:hypothetical protein
VPGGDLRFSTTAVPFAQPGQKHAAVAIATLLGEPLGSEPRDVEIATMALDSDCGDCRKLPSTRQVIRFPPGPPGAQPEVLTRMALAPGSYEIRVAASAAAGAGSVIAHLDVPNFQKDQLSASGLVITARGGIVTGEQNPVADLLPVVPTALRDIDRAIEASAFVRIYQIGARTPSPVQVTATIRDAADTSAFNETTLLEAAAFGSSKTTDYRLVLPVRQLTPGAYLLTIDAVAGKRTVKRETRFQVK